MSISFCRGASGICSFVLRPLMFDRSASSLPTKFLEAPVSISTSAVWLFSLAVRTAGAKLRGVVAKKDNLEL